MFTHEKNSVPELSLDGDGVPANLECTFNSQGLNSQPPPLPDLLTSPAILPCVILKQECSRSQSPEGYALQHRIRPVPPPTSNFNASWTGREGVGRNALHESVNEGSTKKTLPVSPENGDIEDIAETPQHLTAHSSLIHSRISSLIATPQVFEGVSVTTPSEPDTCEAYSSPHFPLDSLTEHLRLYSSSSLSATMDYVDNKDSSAEHQLEQQLPLEIQELLHQPQNASLPQRVFIIALLWQLWPQFRSIPVYEEEVVLFKKGLLDDFTNSIGPIGEDVLNEFTSLKDDQDFTPPDQLTQTDICDPQTMQLKPGFTEEDFDVVPIRFHHLLEEWNMLDVDSPTVKRFYIGEPARLELYPPQYTLTQLRQKRSLDTEGARKARLPSIQLSQIDTWRIADEISNILDIRGDMRVYATTETLNGPIDLTTFKTMPKTLVQPPYTAEKLTPNLVISTKGSLGFIEDGAPSGPVMGTTGLNNLGNTCYMNSALQCLVHVPEIVEYFLSGYYESEINRDNPIGKNGDMALAFAELVRRVFIDKSGSYAPRQFKSIVGEYGHQFAGFGQQDSQEFLAYLLDSLHEDLNRISKKPATSKPELDPKLAGDPREVARVAVESWDVHRLRNDSPILDLFTGLYKSTVVCPVSKQASITFDPFSDLTLPLPVEDSWSKDLIFIPFDTTKRPFIVPVELKKHSRFQELRQHVASKVGENVDPASLMFSEVYSAQFFRHISEGNKESVSELIPVNDAVVVYESGLTAEEMWSYHNDAEPAKFIVPVYHRSLSSMAEVQPSYGSRGSLFLSMPFFITLTDVEAHDFAAVTNLVYQRYFQICQVVDDWATLDKLPFSINFVKPRTTSIPLEGLSVIQDDRVFPMSSRLDVSDSSSDDEDDDDMIVVDDKTDALEKEDVKMSCYNVDGEEESKQEAEGDVQGANNGNDSSEVEISEDESPNSPVASAPSPLISLQDECESDDLPMTTNVLPPPLPPRVNKHPILPSPPPPTHYITRNEGIVCDWNGDEAASFLCDHDSLAKIIDTLPDPEIEAMRAARADRSQKGIELSECLDLFCASEVLSDDDLWYCPSCKDFRQATKKIELWKCPEILVIHLKRFSSSRNFRDKITEVVHFPIEGLDLTDRVGEETSSPQIYDLIGVDNHMGGLGGGHYTAYAKNFVDGKWYHFNDSNVSPISKDQLVTANAYLLFYKKRAPSEGQNAQVETKTHKILRDLVAKRGELDLSSYSSFVPTAEGKLVTNQNGSLVNGRSSGSGRSSSGLGSSQSFGTSSESYSSHSGNGPPPWLKLRVNKTTVSPESTMDNPPAYSGSRSILGTSPQSSAEACDTQPPAGKIPWEEASLTLSSSEEDEILVSDLPTPADSEMESSAYPASERKVDDDDGDDEVIIVDD